MSESCDAKITLFAMAKADAVLAEHSDNSADNSSDEEDELSCASSDVGSEWSLGFLWRASPTFIVLIPK